VHMVLELGHVAHEAAISQHMKSHLFSASIPALFFSLRLMPRPSAYPVFAPAHQCTNCANSTPSNLSGGGTLAELLQRAVR
jgi:hypothetical protein